MGSDRGARVTSGGKRGAVMRGAVLVAATPVVLFALQACGGTAVAPTSAPAANATVAPTVVSDMTQTAPTIVAVASQAASAVASPIASPLATPVASPVGSPAATPAP